MEEKRFHTFKNHETGTIKDFKELLNRAVSLYNNKIAYQFKKDGVDSEIVHVTFSEFKKDIDALATKLMDLGLENKRVALIGNNRYEWCTSYMAVTTGNMVIVPLDKALPNHEIKSLIQRSGASAVIFDGKYEDVFTQLKQEQGHSLQYYICMDTPSNSKFDSYQDMLEQGKKLLKNGDTRHEKAIIDNQKMSIMLFTSGTTARSKAVMLSQNNVCSNINAMPHFVKMYDTDTLLSFLPLHHTFECTISFLYGGLYCGATISFCDGLKYITKNLAEYEVSVFVAVPLMLEMMYKKISKTIKETGKEGLIHAMTTVSNGLLKLHIDARRMFFKPILNNLGGKLRLVLYGGAPMEKSTVIGLSNFGIAMVQGYGLTETSPVIAAETDFYKKPGSTGLIMCNEEVKIDSPNEEQIGEILVKGPNVMLGYYEDEASTNEVLKDGWFYTGDLGYFDEEGFLYITGRKKDVIVLKNGKNIYPQELEFALSKLPFVEEIFVYGKPTKNHDLTIAAQIVYKEENMKELYPDLTPENYFSFMWEEVKKVNQTLSDFKHIKEISITTEPLIKTTTQKVKRADELKKILAQ